MARVFMRVEIVGLDVGIDGRAPFCASNHADRRCAHTATHALITNGGRVYVCEACLDGRYTAEELREAEE